MTLRNTVLVKIEYICFELLKVVMEHFVTLRMDMTQTKTKLDSLHWKYILT